LLYNFI